MNYRIGYLGVLLSSMVLMACGGSSGTSSDNSPPATPTVNTGLSKYEGIWRQECVDHVRLTMTATASATEINKFSVTRNEEYFANADCTGNIVAVGNYGVPDESVTYTAPLENVSILMPSGATILATVDPGTAVSATARYTFTGPGVLASIFEPIAGKTIARIQYTEKVEDESRFELRGQSDSGALVLLEGELYSLVPIENSTSSFRVVHRFFR